MVAEYIIQGKEDNKENEPKTYTLKDLLDKNINFLIIGKKESGRTTLLNYLCLSAIEDYSISSVKLPFYINYQNLPHGKAIDTLKKAMLLFGYDQKIYKELNIDQYLDEGKCLLLIDDFTFQKSKDLKKLETFIATYPNNTYFFAVEEDINFTIDFQQPFDTVIKYEKIFIQQFDRHRIRKLVEKWFQDVNVDIEKILEKLLNIISKINFPRSPTIISFILWLFEKHENFIPTNKASLLEKFFTEILQKTKIEESRYAKIDYRDREHYLSYIAFKMVNENKYFFDNKLTLEKETINYFLMRGLTDSATPFLDYFFRKGIFTELSNGHIAFKYKCFCEYFIAKRMIEDIDFYNKIIKEEHYLSFLNEIDYMTGLQRNNKELLSSLALRLDNFGREIGINDIEISSFDNLNVTNTLFEAKTSAEIQEYANSLDDKRRDELLDVDTSLFELDNKELIKQIRELDEEQLIELIEKTFPNQLTNEEKIDFFKNIKGLDDSQLNEWIKKLNAQADNSQGIRKDIYSDKIYSDSKLMYLTNLVLYSRIIKNCELIEDISFRKINFESCLSAWAKFILLSLNNADETLRDKFSTEFKDKENQISYFIHTFIPLIFETIIFEELGSEKLEILILDILKQSNNYSLLYMLSTFLYADLRLKDYISRIRMLVTRFKNNNYILDLILQKLHIYYIIRKLSKDEKTEIENLITEIYIIKTPKPRGKKLALNIGKIKNSIIKNLSKLESKKPIFLKQEY